MNKANTHAGMQGANQTGLQISASRRSADMFAAAGRHSRHVRILKTAIPLVALLLGGVFVAATVFRPEKQIEVSAEGVSLSDGRIVMAAPKLDGVTGDNKPYTMAAERAYQNVKTGEIELEKITADLPFTGTETAKLTARGGLFNDGKRTLKLSQDIILKTSDGMIAKLTSAHIDINGQHLRTADPVDITTPQARITADTMSVSDGGKVLVFDRKVRMTINPSAIRQSAGPTN